VLTPNANLAFNQRYTVSIPSNALQDIFGNQFSGSTFQFVTAETLGGSAEVIPVTDITITGDSIVNVNQSIKLTVTLAPLNTTQKSVRWTSSDRTIATVDMFGNVYGKRAGTVTITASNGDWSVLDTFEITVNQPVESIEFAESMILKNLASEPSAIPVNIYPLDANNPAVTWLTSNPEVAYVNEEGLLVVLKKGTTVIRATAVDGGQFDDIIVSVSEEALEQVSIRKLGQIVVSSTVYTLAVMNDGTLWIWGGSILVPTKTRYTGIKDIPVYVNNSQMLVLMNDGTLYQIPRNTFHNSIIDVTNISNYNQSTIFSSSRQVSGLNNISTVNQTTSGTYFVLRTNGDVWGWGSNGSYELGDGTNIARSVPQKINGVSNIKKMSVSYNNLLLLSTEGNLYSVGSYGANYSTATLLDTDVIDIQEAFHENRYQKSDGVYYGSPNQEGYKQYNANPSDHFLFQPGTGYQYILTSEGKPIINGVDYPSNVSFVKLGILYYDSIYLISSTGDLYMLGSNYSGQLANFNTTQSFIPTKINFGVVVNEGGLTLESQSVNNGDTNVSLNHTFIFDFNTAIKAGNNLPAIQLKDGDGNFVSVTAVIKLDKLHITVQDVLIYGETYTLILPSHLVVDYFNNVYNGQTLTFTTEEMPASISGLDEDGRFYWNLDDVRQALAAYVAAGGQLGHASSFANNAILNDIQDPVVANWARFTAQDVGYSSSISNYYLTYNYWGTNSEFLIEKHFLDFDDFQQLGNIVGAPFLSTAKAELITDIYPFVSDFYFLVDGLEGKERSDKVSIAGGEMHVIFSQPMDMDILPNVYFGPDFPYTDYKVDGQWISGTHWVGQLRVTLLTGDGYQYMRIRDAVSARDAWLISGDDEKRLQFEIITTGTESMTLQATSAEGRVILDWMQDEYLPELMAGYNVYRASSIDGEFARINTTIISDNAYEDFSVEPGLVYYYKFTVVQTDFSESDFSNIAAANAFDNILPELSHTIIKSIRTGQDNTIVAFATDNIGIQEVTFSYRLAGQTSFTTMDMAEEANTNKYTFLLRSSLITTSTFEYFITASDGLAVASSGTAAAPHSVNVLDVPSINTISPNSGASIGGTVVTITGANFKEGVKVFFAELEGLNVTLIDANRLTVVSPRYYASQVNIRILNPFGSEAVRTNGFTYESSEVSMLIPTVKANMDQTILVPVRVTNVNGLLAVDMVVSFDTEVLTYVEFVKGTMATRFTTFINRNVSGELRISMASDLSVTGSGDILFLKFKVVNAEFEDSSVTLSSVELNGGNIDVNTTNGTITFEPVFTVEGTIFYFGNNAAVESVDIILSSEESEHLGITDAEGEFIFTSITKGEYDFDLSKTGDNEAISALDAALILQHVVALTTLNSNQLIVADVNADGRINSLDASYILQYVAGFTVLPFAGRDTEWLFVSNHSALNDLNANAQLSVTAYLIGDVSGNYGATSSLDASFDGAFRVGSIVSEESLLYVPVDLIINQDNIFALSFRLTFDPSLKIKEVTFHQSLENAFKVANTNVAGQVTVAIAGVDALASIAGLIEVTFETTTVKDTYMFSIVSAMINESKNIINVMNGYTTLATTDFNNDGVVNELDLLSLVDFINATYHDDNISPFDFNNDGIVDLFDMMAMIRAQRTAA